MCLLPFLCFKTYILELQIPWIQNSPAVHKSYLYLLKIFPQKACLPHMLECCARTSVLSLSKLAHLPSIQQLGACQQVLCHRYVTQCRHALCLLCYSPSVHASLCKCLHPLIFRTKDIKPTINLKQNLKFIYPLESLSSDPVFIPDSASSLRDRSKTLDWTHAGAINIWI